MPEQNEKLHREILDDAQRRAERNLQRARREAAAVLDNARKQAARFREEQLAAAREEAESKAQNILAGIEQEIQRAWITKREEVLADVFRQAFDELEALKGEDAARALERLLREAVRPFTRDRKLTVRLMPRDLECLPAEKIRTIVGEELAGIQPGNVTVAPDPAMRSRGVIAESADGRRRCVNTFAARLRRMRERLRPLAAKILQATEPPAPEAPANET